MSLRHIHGHQLEMHKALMQVLDNQCQHGKTLGKIMASNAQLQQSLTDLGTQLDKAHTEITTKIAELEAAIAAGGNTTPEVDAALEALKGKVQNLDDLHPDAT